MRINDVDWTEYPSLPEPPVLPPWKDTPEREACWMELFNLQTKIEVRFSRAVYISSFIFTTGCLFALLLYFRFPFTGELIIAISPTVLSVCLFCSCVIGEFLLLLIALPETWKITRKYGTYPRKLKRPDFSLQIGKILAARPEYSKDAFRRLWPTEKHAEIALEIIKFMTKGRKFFGKMLYPNDPLLLFFYGKNLPWSKSKIIFPRIAFYESMEYYFQFPEEEWDILDFAEVPLAEIVERSIQYSDGK